MQGGKRFETRTVLYLDYCTGCRRSCPDATFTLEVTEAEHAMNWLEDNLWNFMYFSH